MLRTMLGTGGLLVVLISTGCNRESADPSPAATGSRQSTARERAKAAKSPEEAVRAFLAAIRDRDEPAARRLLTPAAREMTANLALLSQLQVTEQARFEVAEVEYLADEGGAHVSSTWTDVDEDGEEFTDRVVWILRDEVEEGWRIAGMAMKVFPDQPPVIFNYEDPEDTARKHQLLEEEFARRAAGDETSDDAATADAEQSPPARQADRRARDDY